MAKKQNAEKIRDEFERMSADIHAWSVTNGGEQVARIVVRYGGRSSPNGLTVRAFVHVLGVPMVRGIARGGGYDMKTAAIANACQFLPSEEPSHIEGIGNVMISGERAQVITSMRALKDQGYGIPHQLREMGYSVDVVM